MDHFRNWIALCESLTQQKSQADYTIWRYLAEKRQVSAYLPEKQPLRLTQFLRRDYTVGRPGDIHSKIKPGGLKDVGGDVRAILGGHRAMPGLINNATGQDLDSATLRAWENGYFPEHDQRPMINDLLDKIAQDFNGDPVFSHHDQDAVDAYEHAQEYNSQINRASAETGISPEGVTADQFWDAVRTHMTGQKNYDPFDDNDDYQHNKAPEYDHELEDIPF